MWSPQQQSMLNAMGYTLYARPGSRPAAASEEISQPRTTITRATDSILFKAVMKAAQGRDVSGLGIDVDALRSSPQAKRALWSQLRRVIKS